MLRIPAKQSQHIDWSGALRSYLARLYGSSADFGQDAAALQAIRQDALGASQNAGGRDLLYRYYVQLDNLSLRIPINEQGCKVQFTWKDLYSNNEISQYSIAFEKAAILFNLAAALWSIGLDTESNKLGFSVFQSAAGIFKLISENFIHAPSPDFESETAKTLQNCAIGHAQALFILTTIEKAPSSLLYQLAQGAYISYNEAAQGLEKIWASNYWGEKNASNQFKFIASYWQAFSTYHYALHLDKTGKHGQAIAYMKEAKSLFSAIWEDFTFKFASTKDVHAYKELSIQKLRAMEKDNDLLYHENVPPISGEIPHKIVATPTDIDKIYPAEEMERVIGRELFSNVVPLEIHETASLYSEELAKLSRAEQEKLHVANKELSSALEYLGLPSSARLLLDPNQDADQGVPSAVSDWSRQISASEPLSFDFPKKLQILSLVETLPESAKSEQQKIKASLVHASNQDETLRKKYETYKQDIAELEDSATLQARFAKPSADNLLDLDEDRSGVDSQLKSVLEIYEKLRRLEKERNQVFNELKQRLLSDDISSALVANRKTMKPQTIFEKELEKFAPWTKRINITISHQHTLLGELTSTWKTILGDSRIKREASAREQRVNTINKQVDKYRNAFQTWLGLHEGVKQAQEFYTQLLAQTKELGTRSSSFNMSSLESSLPAQPQSRMPPVPARPDVSTYSVPSAFNTSLYDSRPPPPPKP